MLNEVPPPECEPMKRCHKCYAQTGNPECKCPPKQPSPAVMSSAKDKAIVELIRAGQYLSDQMAEAAESETAGMRHWRKAVRNALKFPGVKIT